MMKDVAAPASIDEYISGFSGGVKEILEKIRRTVRDAAPGAEEVISYRMPAFMLEGVLVYFAAFKEHIGLYPPVRGDAELEKAVARYAGEKGNLRFPLDEPIPYDLIERIVRLRVGQNLAKASARSRAPAKAKAPAKVKAPVKAPAKVKAPAGVNAKVSTKARSSSRAKTR